MGEDLLDFSERCRLCIEPKRLSIDIFSEEGKRMKLDSKINKHLSLKISQSDGLPSQMCYQCLFRLETWVSFKKLCIERDQVMKSWSQAYSKDNAYEEINHCSSKQKQKPPETNHEKQRKSSPLKRARPDPSPRLSNTTLTRKNSYVECSLADVDVINHSQGPSFVSMNESAQCEALKQLVNLEGIDTNPCVVLDECAQAVILAQDSNIQKGNESRRKQKKCKLNEKHLTVGKSYQTKDDPPLLKRKRGRPSKAFLQLEQELMRLREIEGANDKQSQIKAEVEPVSEGRKSPETQIIVSECDQSPCEEDVHASPRISSPEVTPLVKEEMGKIVVDDPDFGSMKFTLSVVEMDSPISSPPPMEDYKVYPESCTSSCGNMSLDSQHKEDFEGFETPEQSSSTLSKRGKDLVSSKNQSNEIACSKSLNDVRQENDEFIKTLASQRKRSCSASGEFAGYLSTSLQTSSLFCASPRVPCISKSLENVHPDSESPPPKRSFLILHDRTAHSDGEVMET